MDERTDRLRAVLDELISERNEARADANVLLQERDDARRWAEGYRGMLQANGVLPETERLPWEDDDRC